MYCDSTCKKYKAEKLRYGPRYTGNNRYCSHCHIFITFEGIFCPCCSQHLRVKLRSRRTEDYKKKHEHTRI